ncbi:DUF4127 family protein [Anaeroselena agilis]|uniref:DUF4127 family protein n=1 Tax=Anaeroselena agilis TaxID=3063788 RepID=A0ABU3NWQ5_9FIRM|nr:DUF4127 family protein [Selenomonadales bacterium 4137-cl]
MFRRFLCCLAIIAAATATAAALYLNFGYIRTAQPVVLTAPAANGMTVLLVPLDSRPPCTQFVEQLGRLAGIRVVLPPTELLDEYRTPANRTGLRDWLRSQAANADAAIVSVDMLEHGGLLASRLGTGTAADAEAALEALSEAHRSNPQLKIYAFSIIPRLLVADNADSARYQKKMLAYSVLKDEVLTFENPRDRDKLQKVSAQLPPAVVNRYLSLYEANTQLNFRLLAMTEEGVLAGLVIGQDDGFPFGMPNMVKSRLSHYVARRPALADRVVITRGTDEVALTLLGRIAMQAAGYRPRVFVRYSHPEAPGIVMPYMPHSMARTVAEKVALIGGKLVDRADGADFVLYVHAATAKTGPGLPAAAAREVRELMAAGHRVGVVDLSEHFLAEDTLLPHLLRGGADLARLAAYAGWNTTSNSLGTAVTQAAVFTAALAGKGLRTDRLGLYKLQYEFLASRMLDDWYYQKDVQPFVNRRLKMSKVDPYNLGEHMQQVEGWISGLMADRANTLLRDGLAGQTLPVRSADGKRYVVNGLALKCRLPWQRTFEVRLEPTLSFAVVNE